jgi:hypothetical protein
MAEKFKVGDIVEYEWRKGDKERCRVVGQRSCDQLGNALLYLSCIGKPRSGGFVALAKDVRLVKQADVPSISAMAYDWLNSA